MDPYATIPVNYSRYTTISTCVAAADDALRMSQRSAADAEALKKRRAGPPEGDTLPTSVVTVARDCGARFTVETASPEDLLDLFKLALYERRDSLARVVIDKALASATNDAARRVVLSSAMNTLVNGYRVKAAWAESLAVRVLGSNDAAQQMMVQSDTTPKLAGNPTGRFGTIPSTTPLNVPAGSMTLVIEEPQGCLSGYGNAGCDDRQGWTLIRRLRAQYDSTRLKILLVVRASGISLDVAHSPEEEEAALRWFFLEYQKLPVTLSILPVSYAQYPAPDGRFVARDETQGPLWLNVKLIGRDGGVLFDGGKEQQLDVALQTALGASTSAQ